MRRKDVPESALLIGMLGILAEAYKDLSVLASECGIGSDAVCDHPVVATVWDQIRWCVARHHLIIQSTDAERAD